jgi:hypothetical protein
MIDMTETTRRQWEFSWINGSVAAIREESSIDRPSVGYRADISCRAKYGFRIERTSELLHTLDQAKEWCEDSNLWAQKIAKGIKP